MESIELLFRVICLEKLYHPICTDAIFFFSITSIILFSRFTMVEHVNGEESGSRYLIAPILDQDGGEVVCEVTNRFGRDAKIFLLSIEGIKKKIFFYLQFER